MSRSAKRQSIHRGARAALLATTVLGVSGALASAALAQAPRTADNALEEVVVTALAAAREAGLEAAIAPEPDSVRILPAVIEARRR